MAFLIRLLGYQKIKVARARALPPHRDFRDRLIHSLARSSRVTVCLHFLDTRLTCKEAIGILICWHFVIALQRSTLARPPSSSAPARLDDRNEHQIAGTHLSDFKRFSHRRASAIKTHRRRSSSSNSLAHVNVPFAFFSQR